MSELDDYETDALPQDLEQAILYALRGEAPCVGFADRVIAQLEQPAVLGWPVAKQPVARLRRWGTWAAALALGCGLAESGHLWVEHARGVKTQAAQVQQAQDRQAAVAEQQFNTAMRVTDRTLKKTRQQLSRAGVHLTD